jgi:hypothetical protein
METIKNIILTIFGAILYIGGCLVSLVFEALFLLIGLGILLWLISYFF